MNEPRLHLNLLQDSERLSSSPIRVRVMLPILAGLAAVGCLVWWGMLFTQLMVLRTQIASVNDDLSAKKKGHATILAQMASARDMQGELDQLTTYAKGRRTYGPMFASLAEVVSDQIQLTSLSLVLPPPQNLANPNPRLPPLLGPSNTVENVSLHIVGRTTRSVPVDELIKSLRAPAFTNVIRSASIPKGAFRQDSTPGPNGGARLLVFEIDCGCAERRFEK